MYKNGEDSISIEEATSSANLLGLSVEQWAAQYGWSLEGKTTVPEETTPPTEPVKTTAAGDSSLADTSLESLDGNPVQKALKRLSQVNISDDYKSLEENIDVPKVNQVMTETTTGIMMPTGQTYETFVYDDFKEQAKNKLGENASEEDIISEAKLMYLSAAKSDLFNAKIEEIMEDFDDEIYTPMGRLNKYFSFLASEETGEAAEQKKLLQEEIKKSEARAFEQLEKLANNKLAQEAYLETSAVRLNELTAKYEKDPTSITENEAEEYSNLSQSYQNVYNTYKETVDELGKTIETGANLQELVDLTARSYDNVDIVAGRVSSAALNAVGNILNFTAELSPEVIATRIVGGDTQGYVPIYGIPGQITPGQIKFMGDKLVEEAEKITGKIEKRQELSKVNSVEDFAEFALDLFSEQAVNTAITAGVPHVGLGLIAASASGEKFRNMQFEIEELGEKITPLRFYTAGIMYGAGEYITEKIALDQFLGAKKALKKSFNFSKTPLTQSPTTTLSALSKWGTGLNKEGMAELGAQVIGNFADKYVLDKNQSLWSGIGEAYLSGAVMSGLGFGAPALMSDVYHAATTGNEQAAAGRRSARIIEIRKRVDDIYKTSDINDPGVQEALEVLNEEADGLIVEQLKAMKIAEARVDELSKADKRKLLNIDSELWKVKGRADKINANENLTDAEKKPILAKLAVEAEILETNKDAVLGESEASKSNAKAKAFQIRTAASKDLRFFYINSNTIEEGLEDAIKTVNESDLSDETKTSLLQEIAETKVEVAKAKGKGEARNGVYLGAEFGLPIAVVSEAGTKINRSVAAHEIAHATLFKKLLQADTNIIGLANDLRSYMERTYGRIAIEKFEAFDRNYADEENQAIKAEELMTAVVELSRKFDLKTTANKTILGKIFNRFNKIDMEGANTSEIRNGKDVLAAIESFNAAFDTGVISGLAAKIFKGEVKAKINKFKEQEQELRGGKKFSMSKSAERAKAQLEKMQEEGYDPNSYELYEALQGMVGAQLSKYQAKGLQITDEEEAVSDVVSRLYTQRDVNKFDGRGSAYGYLNGRIKFRILDAFKANPVWVENFEDVDVEGLSGKAAREITEETVEPTIKTETIADVTPANEYKNLLRRKVVNDEVIKSIEDKILKTVRLLKSRIDAKVSNNVTVTPIIREIKKEMGKQADIDFKKAMGGKKDGELRKFLLRNKAAILENMSTTWLSQAMPIAIQKKVDGIWVSDWQGKKIDREAMSTDLAGRTSGAELMRRVPKVARAISDSDFLATILQPDGNPIRGKKESLAKAMAEEITFDIIKKSFEDNGPIAEAIIENQKRNGVENAENMGPEFVRQSERGNVKYSKGFYENLWAYIQEQNAINQWDRKAISKLAGGNIDNILEYYNIKGRFTLFIGGKKFNRINDTDITNYINFIINHLAPNLPKEELFPDGSLNTSLLYTSASLANMTDETLKYIQNRIINEVRDGKRPVPGDFNLGVKKDEKGNVVYEEQTVETKFKSFEEFNSAWLEFQKEKGLDIKVKTLKKETDTGRGKRIKPSDLNEEQTNNWVWKVYRTRLSKAGNVVELNENNLTRDDNAEEILSEASDNGDLLIHNVRNEFLFQYMWNNLNNEFQKNLQYQTNEKGEFVRDEKNGKKIPTEKSANIIRGISTWMHLANSDATHPQRRLAQIVAWQKGFKKGNRTNEHGLPNMAVTQTLIFAMLDNAHLFNTRLRQIQQNYVIIPITADADAKINKFNKSTMPADWDIFTGNWFDRSFNADVSKEDLGGNSTRGIDPNTYILAGSKKSLAEVVGVKSDGTYNTAINKLIEYLKGTELEGVTAEQLATKLLKDDRKREDGQRKYSKGFAPPEVLNAQFNAILRRKSGIDGRTEISRTRAQILGKDKGRFKFFIAPGADDFRGLVHYAFAGQGKQGEKDMEFFEKNLMDPYFRGIAAIDAMRQLIKREFKVVTKEFKDEYAMLSEPVPGGPFTYDHAVRVYMWGLAGTEVPGLSDKDRNDLENAILDNPALADLAEALLIVGRREAWPKPSEFWLGDSVLSDLNSMTEKVGRKEILAQFITNVDAIFDEAALNKVEAIKGRKHREALEDSIYAMKNGSNRPSGANIQTNKWINWINGSTGAIMFFNRRSALLQMLSFTNFINWSDNNPIKAAAAFANQKQYWKDFVFLFNSDKLKERRGGLKQDVSESEIAQIAGRSKNSPQAILAYMLKIGFTPTQIADSFAIATGGAGFYRNRVNTYLKEGLSQKKAEEKAFEDFSKASDVAQQSSDPALVSQQQRSILGRFILAFANTPMQYTRLMKKAGQDLINGRGDAKEHISKILYYGFIQNFIFSALQSAMFGLFFDDEEDDEIRKKNADKKLLKTVNSMVDTVLRGSGVYGAIVSTIKNTIQQYYTQEGRGFMADHAYTLLSAFNVSPPIGSKFRKLYTAIQTKRFEEDAIAARGWAITANGRVNLGPNWAILGSLVSGAANVPLDRVYDEINSISEALDARNKAWQRIALALGWKSWDVGAKNEEHDLIETLAKEKRKKEGIEKRKKTVRKKKEALDKKLELMSPQERTEYERNKKK